MRYDEIEPLPSLQVSQANASSYSSTSDPESQDSSQDSVASIEEESVGNSLADNNDKTPIVEEDGGEERQQWSNPIEFLLREELESMTDLPHSSRFCNQLQQNRNVCREEATLFSNQRHSHSTAAASPCPWAWGTCGGSRTPLTRTEGAPSSFPTSSSSSLSEGRSTSWSWLSGSSVPGQ